MNLNYKKIEAAKEGRIRFNVNQLCFVEKYSPKSLPNNCFPNIHPKDLENFDAFCCRMISLSHDKEKRDRVALIHAINYLLAYSHCIEYDQIAKIFVDREIQYILIEIVEDEISGAQNNEALRENDDLLRSALNSINNLSYNSLFVMNAFLNNGLLSILLEYFYNIPADLKHVALNIFANYYGETQISDFFINIGDVINIANDELEASDDTDRESDAVWILSNISYRSDIILEKTTKIILFNIFIHNLSRNTKLCHTLSHSYNGLFYLLKSSPELINCDQHSLLEAGVKIGFESPSSEFCYSALILANALYIYFSDDRLVFFHNLINPKSLCFFLECIETDIQKAVLNILISIVTKRPFLIPSLVNFGVFMVFLEMLKTASFEIKVSICYIIAQTALHGNNELNIFLLNNKLISACSEIMASGFDPETPILNMVLDTLLLFLGNEESKEIMALQLAEIDFPALVEGFQIDDINIQTKLSYIRNILTTSNE